MPGLSGVGGPPGFMSIHELDSLMMHGFSSKTTVPPRTRVDAPWPGHLFGRAFAQTVLTALTFAVSKGTDRGIEDEVAPATTHFCAVTR